MIKLKESSPIVCINVFYGIVLILTGHSNMAVSFAFINHIHNLIRAGHKALSASLSGGENEAEMLSLT